MSLEHMVDEFIGRNKEIEFFNQWLSSTTAPSIIYIHDAPEEKDKKGGIGKTWLLRKYSAIVAQYHDNVIPIFVDFFNVADRDGVVIAERVVQAIQAKYPHWPSETFSKLLNQYHESARGKKAETNSLREQLANVLADDLRMLYMDWIKTNTYLLLLFDTFELIEYNPITAVLRSTQSFPDRYQSDRVRAIIAGRNAPDWSHQNWVGREKEIIVHMLPPFSQEEMKQYLKTRLYVYNTDELPPETLKALYERTEGRPIMVGLITDVLNKRIKDPDALVAVNRSAFEATLVMDINRFDDPSKVAVFSMSHIYHRFDADFLQRLMSWPELKGFVPRDTNYQKLSHELTTLSFVRRSGSGEDFVLHDEMRRLVNDYCWKYQDQNEHIRRELSTLAIDYYNELIDQEDNEEKKHSYIVEKLFHALFLDSESGFQSFEQHFNNAIDLSLRTFARALFQELLKFEMRLSHEQQLAVKLAEARLLLQEENIKAALAVLSTLERNSAWAELHRSDLLYEKGICYLRLNQYAQAIACFETCLDIERSSKDQSRYAGLLSRLGYIYRRQGRNAEAMGFYEEALKVQRNLDNQQEYATLLNNIGNVRRLQGGKLEEALSYCKLALRIRRDLFNQSKASEYYVGLSQSTLGHIYHNLGELDEEEKAYKEAFDIYNRVGDKSAIAGGHNSLGRVFVRKGDLNRALEEFVQAARVAAGLSREAEIESFNQQGRVFLLQENWEKARSFFDQAVSLSRQFDLRFQLAENLLYLAEALDHLDQSSNELVKEAKRTSRENDYTYLLARAGEIQGDIYLRRKEYQIAFKHYRVACRYMAQRGSPEFDRTLRKLNDLLLAVPSGFLPGIIDSLLIYWYELGLDEKFPQLLRICREVSRNMLL